MLQLVEYGNTDGTGSVRPSTDEDFFESLKNIVRLEGYVEDEEFLKLCLDSAFDYLDGVGGMTDRALLKSVYEFTLDCWPLGAVKLRLPPLKEVMSVKITTPSSSEVILTQDIDYRVLRVGSLFEKGLILPVKKWPYISAEGEAVKVRFIAGQGDKPSDLPDNVKAAVIHTAAHRYCHREELTDTPATAAYQGLLSSISLLSV